MYIFPAVIAEPVRPAVRAAVAGFQNANSMCRRLDLLKIKASDQLAMTDDLKIAATARNLSLGDR